MKKATTALTVQDPKAQVAVQNAESVLKRMAELSITNQHEMEVVSATLVDVKRSIAEIEAAFKPLEEPLKAELAKLSAPRLKAVKLLKAGEVSMKEMISDWLRSEQERIDRENEALLAAAQKKEAAKIKRKTGKVVDPTTLDVPASYIEPIALPEGITPVKKWTWRPLEGGLEALVKAAAKESRLLYFLDFNGKTVQDLAVEFEENATLAGVEFYNEGVIRVEKGA